MPAGQADGCRSPVRVSNTVRRDSVARPPQARFPAVPGAALARLPDVARPHGTTAPGTDWKRGRIAIVHTDGAMKKPVTFRMDADLLERARRLADADNRSLTNYIETALRRAIEPAAADRNRKGDA